MPDLIRVNDRITLREDIPQHNLMRGRIGRVLQIFTPGVLECEFANEDAQVIAKVQLKVEQVTVLRHEATLDEAALWKLIEEAKIHSGGDADRQAQYLVDALAKMSVADIFAFEDVFRQLMGQAYQRDLWAAAYIICAGCSDDGFIDFRYYLISLGKKIYDEALRNPETLLDFFEVKEDFGFVYGDYELGAIGSVASNAYEKKTGEPEPIFIGIYTPDELTGDKWQEETFYQKYPKLSAKFHPYED